MYFKRHREAFSTLLIFIAAILLAVFVKSYIIQPYVVDGQSMEMTLQDHDRLLVNKLPRTIARLDGHAYVPKRADIIIFNQSGLPGYSGSKYLIKRVIGLPGDHVVLKGGVLTIYNSTRPKGFQPDNSLGYHINASSTIGETDLHLGQNQLFVCGDNRNNSEDSRYFGPITTDQIVGKLSFRILPLSKAQHF